MEPLFSFVFVAVLLAIPFFFGRSFYRALVTRKRIEQEARDLIFSQARIVGFTEPPDHSEDSARHSAIVEYETPEGKVIWAETQPGDKGYHSPDSAVKIMWRPERPRQAYIIPYKEFSTSVVGFEKSIEIVLSLVGICFLFGVAIYYQGFAIEIIGPLLIMLGIGFGFGHVTRGRSKSDEKRDLESHKRQCDRLIRAQERAVVPCHLKE